VENPISVSVTGAAKEDLLPNISVGTLKKDPSTGEWVAIIPNGVKEAVVTVSVKTSNGIKEMGSFKFRVKKLPDPTPSIAGRKGGFVTKEAIIGAGGLIAKMPVDFEFNFTYNVQSFKLTMTRGFYTYNYISKDGNLTAEMKQEIQRTNRGQILEFEEIVVLGPTNEKRELEPFNITVK
jgi:GldM C-terminal domain